MSVSAKNVNIHRNTTRLTNLTLAISDNVKRFAEDTSNSGIFTNSFIELKSKSKLDYENFEKNVHTTDLVDKSCLTLKKQYNSIVQLKPKISKSKLETHKSGIVLFSPKCDKFKQTADNKTFNFMMNSTLIDMKSKNIIKQECLTNIQQRRKYTQERSENRLLMINLNENIENSMKLGDTRTVETLLKNYLQNSKNTKVINEKKNQLYKLERLFSKLNAYGIG